MVNVMMGTKRTRPNPNRIRRARIETGMEIWAGWKCAGEEVADRVLANVATRGGCL